MLLDYIMNTHKLDEIDALILEEKKSIANEYFSEVWEAANAEGIEPSLMAETLIHNALKQLAAARGDAEANKIIFDIRGMEANGEFLLDKTFQ